ncbi:MAG: glutamine amidotransferase-related protein, partial [Anaerolineae bacterium]
MAEELHVTGPSVGQVSLDEAVAILDFGSQYSQLIARRVRECNVYCQIFRHDEEPAVIQRLAPAGFVLSGGPSSVYDHAAPRLPAYLLETGKPILGICYGMQLLAHELGGQVQPATRREYGPADLSVCDSDNPLFHGLPSTFRVWMSHGDQVIALP